jgi:drug/metabolite transporter (DMT)-like permease
VGAFIFNGTRFLLGSLWLVPFLFLRSRDFSAKNASKNNGALVPGIIMGGVMFAAASLQQIGITFTTAGKAGFITGMYVIFVPLFGIFLKKNIRIMNGVSALFAFGGLYFLSIDQSLILSRGDALVLFSAIFWAVQVLLADYYVDRWDALKLAFIQFVVCGIVSLTIGLMIEDIDWNQLQQALVPIFYAGVFSVGMGFTLQLVGQKEAHPAHASILLSFEAVFAVFGGWLLLNEILSVRELFGCFLMLTGMILSQLQFSQIFKPKLKR